MRVHFGIYSEREGYAKEMRNNSAAKKLAGIWRREMCGT